MYFKPAGEVLGNDHPIRTVTIYDEPRLPDGEYTFVDLYCTDKGCDCRKTIIQIFHENRHVSTVDYGWEDPQYYFKWLKASKDDEMAQDMSGLSIDFMSPDLVSTEGILALVEHLMDESLLYEHMQKQWDKPLPERVDSGRALSQLKITEIDHEKHLIHFLPSRDDFAFFSEQQRLRLSQNNPPTASSESHFSA